MNTIIQNLDRKLQHRLKQMWVSTDKGLAGLIAAVDVSLRRSIGITAKIEEMVRTELGDSSLKSAKITVALGYSMPGLSLSKANDFKGIGGVKRISPEIPEKFNLLQKYGPVRDQGDLGSCVGFAVTASAEAAFGWQQEFSDLFAYYVTKMEDGLDTEGSTLEDGFKAISKWGNCPAGLCPYDVSQLNGGPSAEAFRAAERFRDSDRVMFDIKEISLEIILKVISGYGKKPPAAVSIGIPFFPSSLYNPYFHETGIMIEPIPGEEYKALHALCIIGYEIDYKSPGGGFFILRNSWGTKHAAQNPVAPGCILMSFAYVTKFALEAGCTVSRYAGANHNAEVMDEGFQMEILEEDILAEEGQAGHMIVCGGTGTGKTTRTKDMMVMLADRADFMIVDFHDDYTDPPFLNATGAIVWDVLEKGLPFNMLEPFYDKHTGKSVPVPFHVEAIKNIIKGCSSSLGPRQLEMLAGFLEKLILHKSEAQFSDLEEMIENEKLNRATARTAYGLKDHLGTIMRLRLMDYNPWAYGKNLLKQNISIVFRLKLPDQSEELKKILTTVLISSIFSLYKHGSLEASRPRVLVQDEFHLLKDQSVWERIVREGRKFNLSLWAISQQTDDFDQLWKNVERKLFFSGKAGIETRKIINRFIPDGELDTDKYYKLFRSLRQFDALFVHGSVCKVIPGSAIAQENEWHESLKKHPEVCNGL